MSQAKKNQYKKKNSRSNGSSGWLLVTILGGVLLVAAALFALVRTGAQGAQVPVTVQGRPAIQVDQEKVDLGKMKFNSLADVSFTISNTGDETLRFEQEPYIEVVEGC